MNNINNMNTNLNNLGNINNYGHNQMAHPHSLTHSHAFLAWPLHSRAVPWGGGGGNDEVNDLITRYGASVSCGGCY